MPKSASQGKSQRKEELKKEFNELKDELKILYDLNYELGENNGEAFTVKRDNGSSEPISKGIIKARFDHVIERLFKIENIVFPKRNPTTPTATRELVKNGSIAKLTKLFMDFFSDKKFDLGTVNLYGETVPLKDYLKTFKVGYMTDRLVNNILQRYTKFGFSENSTYNKEHPDSRNGSIICADKLMFKYFKEIFEEIRKFSIEEMEKNGHKEGDPKKSGNKESYQHQWHAFDPSNFLRMEGLGKIKTYARVKDGKPPLLTGEAEKQYVERVVQLLEERPGDLSIYDTAAAELDDEFEEAATIRAAIDHDTKIFSLIKSTSEKNAADNKEKTKKVKNDTEETPKKVNKGKEEKNSKKESNKTDESSDEGSSNNKEEEEKPKKAPRFRKAKE